MIPNDTIQHTKTPLYPQIDRGILKNTSFVVQGVNRVNHWVIDQYTIIELVSTIIEFVLNVTLLVVFDGLVASKLLYEERK